MKTIENWIYKFRSRLFGSAGILLVLLVLLGITMNACNKEGANDVEQIIKKLDSRTDTTGCLNYSEDIRPNCWESGFSFNKLDTIAIDDSCHIEVTWDEFWCTSTNQQGIHEFTLMVDNFRYHILDGECLDTIQKWTELEAMGKTDELAKSIDLFEYIASSVLEKTRILYWELLKHIIPDCNDSDPEVLVFSEYYKNTCFQYFPGPSIGQIPDFTNIIKSPCGQLCCKRSKKYCFDNSHLIVTHLGFELFSGNCGEEPLNPPSGSSQAWGDCDHDCIPY